MSKLDGPLEARMVRYRRALERGPEACQPGQITVDVSIRHTGDADEILAIGLIHASTYPGIVFGGVRLADLERLAALPQVTAVEAQNEPQALLDDSVPDAKVPPLWSGSPSLRGAGVVVGVVDSGIDIFHHAFRKSDGTTRLLALWDQTLDAPNPAGFSYGRLFEPDEINEALEKDPDDAKFPSNDVDGHGTHVAGTAAGDGSQAGNCHGSGFFVGVAPEADLLIVKRSRTRSQAYVDGVEWIFARAGSKAAVANLSIGTSAASHDGTSAAEVALDGLLSGKPDGRAVVTSSGNEANDGMHAHRTLAANGSASMRFTVLAGDRYYFLGSIWYGTAAPPGAPPGPDANAEVRVTLHAPDGTSKSVHLPGSSLTNEAFAGGELDLVPTRNTGRPGRHETWFQVAPAKNGTLMAGEWRIELEETNGDATEVDCWLTPRSNWMLEDTVDANKSMKLTFNVAGNLKGTDTAWLTYSGAARLSVSLTTPDPDSTPTVTANAGQVTHNANDDHRVIFLCKTDHPNAGQHRIEFSIEAVDAGDCVDKGGWTVTLIETAGTPANITVRFPEERPYVTVEKADGSSETVLNAPRFIEADRDPSRTVGSPAAANNVIAVGAYHPETDDLADFSSRGPTVDGRQKPDLSAPGVDITAAKTRVNDSCCISDCCETFYTDMQGTSMAAPHVTGAVALMLQRNKTLDFEEIRDALRDEADPVAGADPQHWGEGKLDAQAAVMSVAAAGGGGGGGGGGFISSSDEIDPVFLSSRATWPLHLPTPERIQTLYRMLAEVPVGATVAALISKHFDEVKAILNTSCRAALTWHRMEGPELTRIALAWPGEPRPFLPDRMNGGPLVEGIRQLLLVLQPVASPELAADIDRYRPFLLALPGARLRDLDRMAGDADGQ